MKKNKLPKLAIIGAFAAPIVAMPFYDKPKTLALVDATGAKYDSAELINGVQENWGTESSVTAANSGAPITYEPVTDANAQVIRYKFYRVKFGTMTKRSTLVTADQNGTAIVGKNITLVPITVDLDDDPATEPEYVDAWDAEKLQIQQPNRQNTYTIMSTALRAQRHYNQHRLVVKRLEADATVNDALKGKRIIDTSGAGFTTDDEADGNWVKAIQNAINELVVFSDDFAKGTPKNFLSVIVSPKVTTHITNTQALWSGSNSQGNLENGSISKINGVEIFEEIYLPDGVDFIVQVRGAIVTPMANANLANYPARTDALKMSFEWAMPKTPGEIFPERIVVGGTPAKINA